MYQFFISKMFIPFYKIYTEPSSREFWNYVYLISPPPTPQSPIIIRTLGRTVKKLLQIFIGHRENNKFKRL